MIYQARTAEQWEQREVINALMQGAIRKEMTEEEARIRCVEASLDGEFKKFKHAVLMRARFTDDHSEMEAMRGEP
jgi:hypothetical protein